MDSKKVYQYLRVCGLVLALSLALAGPVLADPPINDEYHINDAGVESGQLPAALPSLPNPVDMPSVRFPYVDRSAWPTIADEREATKILVENRINLLRSSLNNRYDAARQTVSAVRSTTGMMKEFVGEPMTVYSAVGERTVTVNAMAAEMAQSVEFSLGYARAVSSIGPLGLDLVFCFIGLGWVVFINLISLLIRVIAWFIRMLGKALESIWRLLMILIQVIRLIVAIIDLFWPF